MELIKLVLECLKNIITAHLLLFKLFVTMYLMSVSYYSIGLLIDIIDIIRLRWKSNRGDNINKNAGKCDEKC